MTGISCHPEPALPAGEGFAFPAGLCLSDSTENQYCHPEHSEGSAFPTRPTENNLISRNNTNANLTNYFLPLAFFALLAFCEAISLALVAPLSAPPCFTAAPVPDAAFSLPLAGFFSFFLGAS